MPVGNCTDEDVEYDVVPVQGTQRFSSLEKGGIAAMSVGFVLLLSSGLSPSTSFSLGGGLIVVGALLIVGGLFLRLRNQLTDLRRQAQRKETVAARSETSLAALALNPSSLQKKLLPAHFMDATTFLQDGQRVRFCKPQSSGQNGAEPDEIATVHIGNTQSHVDYLQGGSLTSEILIGTPVAAVMLRYENEQYRVELLAA